MNPTKPQRHGVTTSEGSAFALTLPKTVIRWVEPDERTTVSVTAHGLPLAGDGGTLAVYRRDTTFAGNLTEALKVMGF